MHGGCAAGSGAVSHLFSDRAEILCLFAGAGDRDKTEGGYIVLSFDERITNYTLQRIITGKDIKEKVYYLEVWTTSWDRLTGRHGVQNALVRETAGLPVYIFFQQNYALNNVDMDSVCIYGNLSRLNGSWVALPGLSLGYWLLFNIALF